MMRRPEGGHPPALDEIGRTANKHAGADGENALGALRLSSYQPSTSSSSIIPRFPSDAAV
jgi:hypothetical protein